jgi:hypothetical protein
MVDVGGDDLCCAVGVVERPRLSLSFQTIISAEPSSRPPLSPLSFALNLFLDRCVGAFTRLR